MAGSRAWLAARQQRRRPPPACVQARSLRLTQPGNAGPCLWYQYVPAMGQMKSYSWDSPAGSATCTRGLFRGSCRLRDAPAACRLRLAWRACHAGHCLRHAGAARGSAAGAHLGHARDCAGRTQGGRREGVCGRADCRGQLRAAGGVRAGRATAVLAGPGSHKRIHHPPPSMMFVPLCRMPCLPSSRGARRCSSGPWLWAAAACAQGSAAGTGSRPQDGPQGGPPHALIPGSGPMMMMSTPHQCMVAAASRLFVRRTITRSPTLQVSVGPGISAGGWGWRAGMACGASEAGLSQVSLLPPPGLRDAQAAAMPRARHACFPKKPGGSQALLLQAGVWKGGRAGGQAGRQVAGGRAGGHSRPLMAMTGRLKPSGAASTHSSVQL